jgi:hypothetical protein
MILTRCVSVLLGQATVELLRDHCKVFGIEHPPKGKHEQMEELTTIVQSKFSEAVLLLLAALAQTSKRLRSILVERDAVAVAVRYLDMYDMHNPVDLWIPSVLQALSLLCSLSALQVARCQVREIFSAPANDLVKVLVAIKIGPNR